MPNIDVLDMAGKKVGEAELSESVFGIEPNTVVMHQMVVNYLANNRQGTQSALTRAEVRGGGKKPWKQIRRLAMKSAFSSKLKDSQLVVVDAVTVDDYSTKTIAAMLKAIGADNKALIVLDAADTKVVNSARNIPGVKTAQVNTLNVYDIMNADKLVIVKNAISKIEEVYA